MNKHILLTVLGKQARKSTYTLNGNSVKAELAPLALLRLLQDESMPTHVVALCTEEATEHTWPILERDLSANYHIKKIDVPNGFEQRDMREFLDKILTNDIFRQERHITTESTYDSNDSSYNESRQISLTVDVTHGFRHFSFLTYMAVLYLTALRGHRLRAAYYGMLNSDSETCSPFLDLRPLLSLPQWFHAIKVLNETGSTKSISQLLKAETNIQLGFILAKKLEILSKMYMSAIPLEFCRMSSVILKNRENLVKILGKEQKLPLADELVENLISGLKKFAHDSNKTSDAWKSHVLLTRDELARHANIVDKLMSQGHVVPALGLMREWTISWTIHSLSQNDDWLNHKGIRNTATRRINLISILYANKKKYGNLSSLLNEEQARLGDFWNRLRNIRNAYAHHGMRAESLIAKQAHKKDMKMIKEYWHNTLRQMPDICLNLPNAEGPLLISPIGKQPGVLFSAIEMARLKSKTPLNDCLIVCSKETGSRIEETLAKANYQANYSTLVLIDPFRGIDEISGLVSQNLKSIALASEIFVNITGGTTLMGLLATKLADEAASLSKSVHRFGLFDKRPYEEIEADPFCLGEAFWINDN